MNKKLLSIAMALLLAAAPLSVAASADEDTAEEKSTTGTIFFDVGDWNHDDKICFYMWDATTGLCANNTGWKEGNFWGSKKIIGTPVEGKDGIVESYEVTLTEGHDTFVIFHDLTTGEQTFNCVLTPEAIGKTAHMAAEVIENPEDSEKTAIAAVFDDAEGCGPQLTITSTGNVVGQYMAPNANPAKEVAQYVYKRVGTMDKTGVECCSNEKVAKAIEAFKTTPEAVWEEFQKFNGAEGYEAYAEKEASSKAVIFGEAAPVQSPDVPVQSPDVPAGKTGTFFFDMGSWNHDYNNQISFYMWAKNADGSDVKFGSKDGWKTDNNWGSKKTFGTPVEGKDGIVESYPVEFLDGYDIFCIVYSPDLGDQTFNSILTANAIGDTCRIVEGEIENPEDSEKTCKVLAFDKAADCGPQLTITSTGNVVGSVKASNENGAATVARYVYKKVGAKDKSGVECCTNEKVAKAIEAFGTTPEAVWEEFQKFNGAEGYEAYAEKEAPSKAVIFGEAKPARKLGDVDGDDKVSAKDAMLIQRYVIKLAKLDDEQLAAADVDGDNKVANKDALLILRSAINLAKIPPERSGSAA